MNTYVPSTLLEVVRYFADPEVCRESLAALRWPTGVTCPRVGCGSQEVWFIRTRGIWRCKKCLRQFSVKVGTIFEDSPIPLEKWLPAVWVLTSSKKGVSSYHLKRALDVTQRTAWFMLHRIRHAMKMKSYLAPLSGQVEVDETFVGGKEKFKHATRRLHRGRGGIGKAAVMGLLARHGEIRARSVQSRRKGELQAEVRQHVAPGSTVYSDALASYDGLARDYIHEVIDHSEAYVRGLVHTNGVENFWSLFKRGIYGTHHSVEPVHLDRYLDDATFRFNTRKLTDGARFAKTIGATHGRRLTYKSLTCGDSA